MNTERDIDVDLFFKEFPRLATLTREEARTYMWEIREFYYDFCLEKIKKLTEKPERICQSKYDRMNEIGEQFREHYEIYEDSQDLLYILAKMPDYRWEQMKEVYTGV